MSFTHAVQECFKSLLANPFLGWPREVASPKLWGLRSIGVPGFRNYLVFYTVDSEAVVIVRVLHGSQDIDSILAEEEL